MVKKIFGLAIYALIGLGILTSTLIKNNTAFYTVLLIIICVFFIAGIKEHYRELRG